MLRNKKLTTAWVLFAVWLYGAWAVTELLLVPQLQKAVPNEYLLVLLRDGLLKNVIWTLPACLLIRHFSRSLAIPAKELFSFHRKDLRYLLPLGGLLAVFVVLGAVMRHGFSLSESFHPSQLLIVPFVGISEESVFRGFLLNATLKGAETDRPKIIAVAVNAVMFLVVHFPIWISSGVFVQSFTHFGFITILVLSGLFSFCTIRCRSLWVAVILHSVYDGLVFLLV